MLADLGRLNDVQLSKLHTERLKQSLNATQRVSPVLEKEEKHEKVDIVKIEKNEDHFKSLISALTDNMDHIVAAVGAARPKAKAQPNGRAPSDF